MSTNQLPPVAKSFFTFCKKCEADRYHTVITHTSAKSAKLKCEVCGSSRTYTLESEKAKRSPSAKSGTGVKRSSGAQRMSSHKAEYENLLSSVGSAEVPYNMKVKFSKNQKMTHPKFGIGFVREIFTDKVEVVFADEVRSLVHNRQ